MLGIIMVTTMVIGGLIIIASPIIVGCLLIKKLFMKPVIILMR